MLRLRNPARANFLKRRIRLRADLRFSAWEGAQPVRHSLLNACCRMLERDVGSSCAADREDAIPPGPGFNPGKRPKTLRPEKGASPIGFTAGTFDPNALQGMPPQYDNSRG
jgi:hypothetical protein